VLDVHLEAGTAGHRGVGVTLAHTHALGEIERGQCPVGGDHRVDVSNREPGVVVGRSDHVHLEPRDRTVERTGRRHGIDGPDDGGAASKRVWHGLSSEVRRASSLT
jgi:hypothetical protein